MNKPFQTFLKEVLANVKRTYTYDQIVHMLAQKITEPIVFGSKKKNPSGYIKKVIEPSNNMFISMRFGTHLPVLKHLISENNIPSDKDYAHNCLLFLGAEEYKNLKTEKGNHQMGERRTDVEVDVNYDVFEYYKLPKKIPYHIYHLIPELINENDVNLIAGEVNEWLSYNGDEPLMMLDELSQDAYYRKHDKSGISSIDCYIEIYAKGHKPTKESIEIIGGKKPIMSINMSSLTLVAPNGEELLLQGRLDVMQCNSRDLSLLREIASAFVKSGKEDFSFDAALKAEEETKKRFESLKSVQSKYPRLYEKIMQEVNKILDEYIGIKEEHSG